MTNTRGKAIQSTVFRAVLLTAVAVPRASSLAQQLPWVGEGQTLVVTTFYVNDWFEYINYGTIDIQAGTVINNETLYNWYDATIYNLGVIENNGYLHNIAGIIASNGLVINRGTFAGLSENGGTIQNSGVIGVGYNSGNVNNSGSFGAETNSGFVDNSTSGIAGVRLNSGAIRNWGTLKFTWRETSGGLVLSHENAGVVESSGTIENTGITNNTNSITSSGTFRNEHVLNNSGLIDNQGTFDSRGTIDNTGTLANSGSLVNDMPPVHNGIHAHISNSGTVTNGGYLLNNRRNPGEFYPSYPGHMGVIDNSGTLDNLGTLDNRGRINNYGTVENRLGAVFVNDGVFDNTTGTFHNSGTFQGTGTYYGIFDTGSGILAPGNSAGTLSLNGDYLLGDGGTLEIEIGGFDTGESDLLDITGIAGLTGGTIHLLFLDDYDISSDVLPGQSMSLMFLEADGGITSFASTISYDFLGMPAGFTYDVFQEGNGLWFRGTNTNDSAVPVPVPGAGMLVILGLSCAGIRLRREPAHDRRRRSPRNA